MKNQNWSGGRLQEISAEISRVFNGQPVVDAKNDLRIVILSTDISKGKVKDFEHCVFAEACKRVFNSKKVLFMRSIAYISLPDENGTYKVERYIISTGGKKVIADFDKGKLPRPGTSFVFKAPTKSTTLDSMRAAMRKHYTKRKREAKLIGNIKAVDFKQAESIQNAKKSKHIKQPSNIKIDDVRNGTGLIQMRKS